MQCPQCKVEYESKHGAKTCGKEECVKQYKSDSRKDKYKKNRKAILDKVEDYRKKYPEEVRRSSRDSVRRKRLAITTVEQEALDRVKALPDSNHHQLAKFARETTEGLRKVKPYVMFREASSVEVLVARLVLTDEPKQALQTSHTVSPFLTPL